MEAIERKRWNHGCLHVRIVQRYRTVCNLLCARSRPFVRPSVCLTLSFCDVEVSWLHSLGIAIGYFENNFTAVHSLQTPTSRI